MVQAGGHGLTLTILLLILFAGRGIGGGGEFGFGVGVGGIRMGTPLGRLQIKPTGSLGLGYIRSLKRSYERCAL